MAPSQNVMVSGLEHALLLSTRLTPGCLSYRVHGGLGARRTQFALAQVLDADVVGNPRAGRHARGDPQRGHAELALHRLAQLVRTRCRDAEAGNGCANEGVRARDVDGSEARIVHFEDEQWTAG